VSSVPLWCAFVAILTHQATSPVDRIDDGAQLGLIGGDPQRQNRSSGLAKPFPMRTNALPA